MTPYMFQHRVNSRLSTVYRLHGRHQWTPKEFFAILEGYVKELRRNIEAELDTDAQLDATLDIVAVIKNYANVSQCGLELGGYQNAKKHDPWEKK